MTTQTRRTAIVNRSARALRAASAKALVVIVLGTGMIATSGSAYESPSRGDQTRTDLLSAARPLAEWSLGAPVEFIVTDLRVAGRAAFMAVTAQRPGGGSIDVSQSPLATRDGVDIDMIDGSRMEVLFLKSGTQWVPVHHSVGSTDVWYAWDAYCPDWSAVLPEFCKE